MHPTISLQEGGNAKLDMSQRAALHARAGPDPAIVAWLRRGVHRLPDDPRLQARPAGLGARRSPQSREVFVTRLDRPRAELDRSVEPAGGTVT